MYYFFSIGIELFSAAVILLPIFLILHRVRFRKLSVTASSFLLALYFAGLYFSTGLPTVLFLRFDPSFCLVPGFDIRNSLLNILLFLPLGFLVPIFCQQFRNFKSAFLLSLFCSLFIELFQIFTYRLSDINDLITNILGTVLGYLLARPLFRKVTKLPQLSPMDLCLICSVMAAVMFFLQPLLVNFLWSLIP